jgi:MFS transporter, FHS family, L-fucose permease
MENNYGPAKLIPVMFAFFIMGFVDVVGISVNYARIDFNLSNTLANFLPMMVFLWFAIFSLPTGILMNRIGRKNTVILSMFITLIAFIIPLISYTYLTMLLAFSLLGIGNTILQVSLNPLVSNLVAKNKLTSFLTLGQFVKAISSLLGPIIASFAVISLGKWNLIFPIFAAVTLLSTIWLLTVPIQKEEKTSKTTSFKDVFSLFNDKPILFLFLGILFIVGFDVGMNLSIPKILMDKTGMEMERAGLGISLYFMARTIGTLAGAFILAHYPAFRFLKVTMLLALVAVLSMIFIDNSVMLLSLFALSGLLIANVFSIIFSVAIRFKPDYANEISGLMIMGVAGGAVLPPVMGIVSDLTGPAGGLIILGGAILYLFFLPDMVRENN